MEVTLRKKMLITSAAYQLMVKHSILTENDKVELINGEILEMSPIGSKHSGIVNKLNRLFQIHLENTVIIAIQNPIDLSEYSQPEPDISLLKMREDFYTQSHPRPQDILLLIEVADSTINFDREVKMPLYAEAGIFEFWLVDIENEVVEVYLKPKNGLYTSKSIFKIGESITSDALNIKFPLNLIF